MCKVMKFITLLFFVVYAVNTSEAKTTYFGAPSEIKDWSVSCSVDKGSITRNGDEWTFKTSKNKCVGGNLESKG